MTGGIPCVKTFERVFEIIDSKELEKILVDFLMIFSITNEMNQDIIDIDGRVNRGSARKETSYNKSIKPLNVLNAYSNNYGMYFLALCKKK